MSDKDKSVDKSVKDNVRQENESRIEETDRENDHQEVGGRDGLEPTRYGDWEKNGRCIDF